MQNEEVKSGSRKGAESAESAESAKTKNVSRGDAESAKVKDERLIDSSQSRPMRRRLFVLSSWHFDSFLCVLASLRETFLVARMKRSAIRVWAGPSRGQFT